MVGEGEGCRHVSEADPGYSMLRTDSKLYLYSEVADTMLPGKVSKVQLHRNRTRNRHRWSGRVDQSA